MLSEHAVGAPDQGRAEQAPELEQDDASSRCSLEWYEKDAEETPGTDEALFDHLGAIGFALAKSAALRPEFRPQTKSRNAIDGCWMKPMTGTCTEEDKDNLNSCMDLFFTRRPVLQSTPPRQDTDKPRVLKTHLLR